jgi:hypothetical protein
VGVFNCMWHQGACVVHYWPSTAGYYVRYVQYMSVTRTQPPDSGDRSLHSMNPAAYACPCHEFTWQLALLLHCLLIFSALAYSLHQARQITVTMWFLCCCNFCLQTMTAHGTCPSPSPSPAC